jgi:hypothetical protein
MNTPLSLSSVARAFDAASILFLVLGMAASAALFQLTL